MADINYQFEIFKYESEEETQFNELRTIEKEDGNILFCASDVASRPLKSILLSDIQQYNYQTSIVNLQVFVSLGIETCRFL